MAFGQISGPAEAPPGTPPAGTPPEVVVSQPLSRQVSDYEDFTGRIEAVRSVKIRPQVNGQIEKVNFQDGAMVQEGDPLFEIDPRTYQGELEKAQAELTRSEARLKRTTAALERAKRLKPSGAISEEDFARIAGDREEADSALVVARVNRDLARLNLERTRVAAPISGRIGRTLLSAGSVVKAGDSLLTTVASVDPMYADFDVDERTLLQLRKLLREGKIKAKHESELAVSMGLANDEGFPRRGTVNFVDNQVDPKTGTIRMRALFPNVDQVLVPGLFARIRLMTSDPYQALLIAKQAIHEYEPIPNTNLFRRPEGGPYVLVVNDKNLVVRRTVTLSKAIEGLQVVRSGLSTNDWVVIDNLGVAVDTGFIVKPRKNPMPEKFEGPTLP
jgi:RND family efflux transporter MFP subunit